MPEMLRTLTIAWWPAGGQGRSRRNAWAAMSTDAIRARARAEAAAALSAAAAVHDMPTAAAASAHG